MTQQESRRLRRPLRMVAREISHTLLVEMSGNQVCDSPPPESVLQLLLQLLHQEVLEQLRTANAAEGPSNEQLADRLAKAERSWSGRPWAQWTTMTMSQAQEEPASPTSSTPSPSTRTRTPSYGTWRGSRSGGGVKLVIMNFND